MNISEERLETDVLVIGGGCAGSWAALRAKELGVRVTLVDKGVVARTGTTVYCHDLMAPMPEEEEETWLKEVVEHTEYMSDQQYALIMLREGGDRIKNLIDWGMPFERDEKGELYQAIGRGHTVSKVVLYDGRKMMEVLRRQLLARGVELVERVMVTDLLTCQGRVTGAVGLHTRTGKFFVFKAKAVVLCTGMISGKLHFSYADNLTGDGRAMAFSAGAELAGLEFTFNPNFSCPYAGGFATGTGLIQFQTLGAFILNARGERFMEKYVPERKERRSHFGFLALAMMKEIMEGRGPVYFDMRHFSEEKLQQVRRIIPITMAGLDNAGIDPSKELVECRPLVISFGTSRNGGIKVNAEGESSLPGLLAAGVEAHFAGASESLSGGMIAACQVFGHRAGERAAQIALGADGPGIDEQELARARSLVFSPLEKRKGIKPREIYNRLMRKIIQPQYSLIKSQGTIKEMLKEIENTAQEDLSRVAASDIHELIKANEVRNFLTILEPIYISALERTESRLAHYRVEYPYRDDIDWLKWVKVKKEKGKVLVDFYPIPIEGSRIKPEKRERLGSPITFSQAR